MTVDGKIIVILKLSIFFLVDVELYPHGIASIFRNVLKLFVWVKLKLFLTIFFSLSDLEIKPAPGDHKSNFKKVSAIPSEPFFLLYCFNTGRIINHFRIIHEYEMKYYIKMHSHLCFLFYLIQYGFSPVAGVFIFMMFYNRRYFNGFIKRL